MVGWLVMGSLALFSACRGEEAEVPQALSAPEGMIRLTEAQLASAQIEVVQASEGGGLRFVDVPGVVASPDTAQATVGSIVEGRVVRVNVVPGDRVRRGQPLVEIHTHELADAQAEHGAATAELDFAKAAMDRAETLYEAGAISLEQVQRRRADLNAAEAQFARTEEIVAHLYPTPAGDAAAVAPRSGVVFSVEARTGQAVVPGSPLVEMGTTSVLWVTAFVPEAVAAHLSPGAEARVSFGAISNETTTARLVRAGQFVDAESRAVEMRFELDSIPSGVRPGTFSTVMIPEVDAVSGVRLPARAVVRLGEEDVVFVVEGAGLFRPQLVAATHLGDEVVADGIPPGTEVVIEGAYFLKSMLELAGVEESEP